MITLKKAYDIVEDIRDNIKNSNKARKLIDQNYKKENSDYIASKLHSDDYDKLIGGFDIRGRNKKLKHSVLLFETGELLYTHFIPGDEYDDSDDDNDYTDGAFVFGGENIYYRMWVFMEVSPKIKKAILANK